MNSKYRAGEAGHCAERDQKFLLVPPCKSVCSDLTNLLPRMKYLLAQRIYDGHSGLFIAVFFPCLKTKIDCENQDKLLPLHRADFGGGRCD